MMKQKYPPPPPPVPAPAPASSASSSEPTRQKIEWPQPVRDYVQRCFEAQNMIAGIDRVEMEKKLKITISSAADNGTLHTIDWLTLPLPQVLIQQDRARERLQQAVDFQMPGYGYANAGQNFNAKKRKSQELGGNDEDTTSTPPWHSTNNQNGFEDRVTFQSGKFDKRQ